MRSRFDWSGCWAVRVLVVGVCTLTLQAAEGAARRISSGDLAVEISPQPAGLHVEKHGVEFIRHSELVVTRPPWSPHYYWGPTAAAIASAPEDVASGSNELRLQHGGDGDAFVGVETLRVVSENRLEQTFTGRFSGEGSALVQWRIGAINPSLIVGRPFTVTMPDGSTQTGVVPVTPREGRASETPLGKGFKAIAFESRVGRISITVEEGPELIVYDYRRDRWARKNDPLFWFGDLGTSLPSGDSVTYRIVYTFEDAPETAAETDAIEAAAQVKPVALAQSWRRTEPPQIIPKPKQVVYLHGMATISDIGALRIDRVNGDDGGAFPDDVAGVEAALRDRLGRLAAEAAGLPAADVDSDSTAAEEATPPEQPALRLELAAELPGATAGGYELEVQAASVVLRAADTEGFWNALWTLLQLANVDENGRVHIQTARIRDWPSLQFRGIHLFTGGEGPELHLRLLERILAPLKLNALVLQAEYIEWDAFPQLHHPQYGMPKAEVRQILETARRLNVEVIPLVMSLGHSQWLFETGAFLELAEDPEAKYAYCVTNPDTYDVIFKVYAEALELFQPKWFHIGHDEFDNQGRVPYRESSKPYSVEELFLMDTLKLHDWFAERGVRLMMWGDMLLANGEAPDACHGKSKESADRLREAIPDDVCITDWHYIAAPAEQYTSLETFRNEGHETIAATWSLPANITNFAHAAFSRKSRGLLQTTWAGYSLDPMRFEQAIEQYASYVLAAEAAWNADNPPNPETYLGGETFLRLMGLSSYKQRTTAGWVANLEAAYNYPLAAGDASGWFGLGPKYDLRQVPAGDCLIDGIRFHLGASSRPGEASAIALRGRLSEGRALPTGATITMDAKADTLVFLHTMSFPAARNQTVGRYTVTYDDGQQATIELVYGKNIFAVTDNNVSVDAPILWSGSTAARAQVNLRGLFWENPRPDAGTVRISLQSEDSPGSLLLVGLTGFTSGATE